MTKQPPGKLPGPSLPWSHLALWAALAVAGCVHNPVTGEREFGFVSTAEEISIGEQQYAPAQQVQGGLYRVDPGLTAYVQAVGERLAAHSGIDLPYEFVVLNSSAPNAWALPGGKVAVNRGLLTELASEAELAAVLGHEVMHAAARHGAKAIERSVVTQVVLVGAAIGGGGSEYAATALGAAQMAGGLINQKYGRDAEREADFYGTRLMARAGYDPYAAVTLQETFLRLAEGGDASWVAGLFASHPPSAERVFNNRGLVEQLRAEGFHDGELGAESYQRAIARLREDQDAYRAYDQAAKALAQDRLVEADTLVEQAIDGQGREAAFHGMRGDLRLTQKRYADAVINYDRAIERDPEYFAYYLGRGVALSRQGERQRASADLGRSLELLPTAVAYSELAGMAETEGDLDTAIRYYQTAAQSDSVTGRAAQIRALSLDVPRHPDQYLGTRLSRDAGGRLVLQVNNRTSVGLSRVEVQVQTVDAAGQTRTYRKLLQRIAPGATQLVLVSDAAGDLANARVAVVSARVEP